MDCEGKEHEAPFCHACNSVPTQDCGREHPLMVVGLRFDGQSVPEGGVAGGQAMSHEERLHVALSRCLWVERLLVRAASSEGTKTDLASALETLHGAMVVLRGRCG